MRLRYILTFTAVLLLLLASPAAGQSGQTVEGTADFRNPPVLRPGSYQDTIVTGETVWYAVVYTNNAPYRFEVSIAGESAESDELDLGAVFVGPTLDSVGGRATVLEGSARYSGGDTNVWYLRVSLLSSGRQGVQYQVTIDVDGVNDARLQRCDDLPDCTADEELAAVEDEIAELEANLAELPEQITEEQVQAEIDEANSKLDSANEEIESANDAIADICSPDLDCTTAPPPGSSTSTVGLLIGGLVLLGGLGFAGLQLARRS